MRIELSVIGPAGPRDVAVLAEGATLLDEVLPLLATAAGVPTGTLPVITPAGAQPAGPTAVLAANVLSTGCTVAFDGRAPALPQAGARTLRVVGGPHAGSEVELGVGSILIGREASCQLVLDDDRVSRSHARIDAGRAGFTVSDTGSTNGTTVDGDEVGHGGRPLAPDAVLRVGDSHLAIGAATTAVTHDRLDGGQVLVIRSPRRTVARPADVIDVPAAPQTTRPTRIQWVTMAVPVVAGGAMALVLAAPQYLLFMLFSPLMLISGAIGDRRYLRRSRRRADARHARVHAAALENVASVLAAECRARRHAAPDPVEVREIAAGRGQRLWERQVRQADQLQVRLGLADVESDVRRRTGTTVDPAGLLTAMPVCVDLARGPLGLAGPAETMSGTAFWLVAQLATLSSPRDVEFVFLVHGRSADQWEWARWLPHTRCVTAADEWATTIAGLAAETTRRRRTSRPSAAWEGRWIVLVVEPAGHRAGTTGLVELLAAGVDVGVTAVCIGEQFAEVPAGCVAFAQVQHPTTTRLTLRTRSACPSKRSEHNADGERADIVADRVSSPWAEAVARALAPLVDIETTNSGPLPASCHLDELLAVGHDAITGRWRSSNGGARSIIGLGRDGPIELDLAADGPHALVAGTTGSGKSELLRTLVLGLAIHHPPDQLTFLLIDYKGGAAFGACRDLPHTAGLVTDLDPYLTGRALQSLHAELHHREQLFARAGVADLPAYRAAQGTPPIARLVIVVDEFAALAHELPTFVTGLVGVAQRGRSLGVHLVLATQRPGSAVSPEIRANTSLRIALRVTDVAESIDVIDAADACLIDVAGRAFLRSGTTLIGFQTALASASRTDTTTRVEPLGPWRRPLEPQQPLHGTSDRGDAATALVSTVRSCAEVGTYRSARSPWCIPLADVLGLADLPRPARGAAIGQLDRPAQQDQPLLTVDLDDHSALVVVGAAGSGRTTTLATIALSLAERYHPDELAIYVVDGTGVLVQALAGLAQLATVLGPSELDLVPTLLDRLTGCGASAQPSGGPRPLLLLDAWDATLAHLDDADAAHCADAIAAVLRSHSITVVVSGDRGLLLPRFAGSFSDRLLLPLSDRSDYGLAGVAARDVPTSRVPGRGVRASDSLSFQIAHPGRTPDLPGLQHRARQITARTGIRSAVHDASVVRLRQLPDRVPLTDLAPTSAAFALGRAGAQADVCAVDLLGCRARLLVAGPPRSGRSTLLLTLLREGQRLGVQVIVAGPARSPLVAAGRAAGTVVLLPGPGHTVPATDGATLLLIDDVDAVNDTTVGESLLDRIRDDEAPLAVAVAGRTDDLAVSYRGLAAEVRRSRCGVLLAPGPVDGELLGARLARSSRRAPPGRGVIIGDPAWGPLFGSGEPVPIQVALP